MGETRIFCDNCGEDITEDAKRQFWHSSLPVDIESANKGESGVLCDECQYDLIDSEKEWRVVGRTVIGWSVTVKAVTAEDATDKVLGGEYDDSAYESDEGEPEVTKVEEVKK